VKVNTTSIDKAARELVTVRDLLRYAVSRFQAAQLFHGHGATNAVDEAAFIILEGLHLPVNDINPWAEARLTLAERKHLLGLIETRVATRKPAAYLLGRTYIQGIPFRVDERVIVPRSYIGELLLSGEPHARGLMFISEPERISRVLDLCTGSGCLAVIAAHAFPNASIDAVDLSADALEVARLNVDDSGFADRITLHEGDLFAPLGTQRYDLIISNPPYVDAEAMAALPPEYRHEPALALAGGPDGLAIVRRILDEAGEHLHPGGGLLCEIGTGREILEEDYPELDFLWLDTEESEGEVFWVSSDSPLPGRERKGPGAQATGR
jgi:ribosomal protein L3 glutamine methyltransferase